MQPEMLVSRSYFLDHRRFKIPLELNDKLNTPARDREWADGQWHPEDMLTVKIVDADGGLLGLISVDEPVNGLIPDRAHVQAIEFFADQCAVAVTHARRYEEVRAEALTDSLTGLANRRALDAAVVRAIARARRDAALCTVLFIDIDHFKDINDSLGHAVGDSVLQAVGRGSGIVFDAAICWRATEARSSSHCCPTRTSRPRCGLPRSSGAVSPRSTSTR